MAWRGLGGWGYVSGVLVQVKGASEEMRGWRGEGCVSVDAFTVDLLFKV